MEDTTGIKIVDDNGRMCAIYDENPIYQFSVYPAHELGNVREYLVRLTSKCLVDQLKERSKKTNARSLLGECNKNSVELLEYLDHHGLDADLYLGYNNESGRAKSVIDAYEKEIVHFWVEFDDYTLEICSECEGCVGFMYVSKHRPSNYAEIAELNTKYLKKEGYPYPKLENVHKMTN